MDVPISIGSRPISDDHPWQDDAACAEIGGDTWFPESGGAIADPVRICMGCSARVECLEYALEHSTTVGRFGIWGGLSERERRRMKRQRAAGAVTEEAAA